MYARRTIMPGEPVVVYHGLQVANALEICDKIGEIKLIAPGI